MTELRAHYRFMGGHSPRDIYVGAAGSDLPPVRESIRRSLAAQVFVMRQSAGHGRYMDVSDLEAYRMNPSAPSRTYVANSSEFLRLNNSLGYAMVGARIQEGGVIRVPEITIREHTLSRGTHGAVTAALLHPLLTDFAPQADEAGGLQALDLIVHSSAPSELGVATMGDLGFERIEGGFRGEAQQVYTRIGALGLQEVPL